MSNTPSDPDIRSELAKSSIPEHQDGFFEVLEEKLSETQLPHRIRRHRLRIMSAAAAPIAAAAAALFIFTNSNSASTPHPQIAQPTTTAVMTPPVTELKPLLAADVIKRANDTISSIRSVSGTLDTKNFAFVDISGYKSEAYSSHADFKITSNGATYSDVATTNSDNSKSRVLESFDAKTGEFRSYQPSGAYPDQGSIEIGTRLDPRTNLTVDRLDLFTSSVRGLASAKDPSLKDVTFNDRPAWRLEVDGIIDELGVGPDHWVVTLDKETAFPVRVYGTYKGQPAEDNVVSKLQVNQDFTPAQLKVQFPKNAEPQHTTGPYKRVQLGQVEKTVGYKAFIPASLPSGFGLGEISVAKDAGPGGPEGSNANNKNIVFTTYRKGLQQIVVTTRLSANAGQTWNDPLSYEGEPASPKEDVVLQGGAFNGVKATLRVKGKSIPHVWAIGAHYLLTVSGDASRDDLVDIAQSLQQ